MLASVKHVYDVVGSYLTQDGGGIKQIESSYIATEHLDWTASISLNLMASRPEPNNMPT